MNNQPNINEDYIDEDSFSIIKFLSKFTRYWRWFLSCALIALFIGYVYMRYAPIIYVSAAKIKIIDESQQSDITSSVEKSIFNTSGINLDNEIEVLKSHRLLEEVVTELNLDVSYYYVGFFKTSEIWNQPFTVTKFISSDSLLSPKYYYVKITSEEFIVTDDNYVDYVFGFESENNSASGLPFSIEILKGIDPKEYEDDKYLVMLSPRKDATLTLQNQFEAQPANKKSDILTLWTTGESIERSETILNTIIRKFNQDGIEDKQAISKRTVDFIDERFIYLNGELDSIESGKQDFKQDNTLAYIEEDATTILKRKSEAEEESFNLETQLSLLRLLRSALVKEQEYGLLPPDIGLDNSSINSLVSKYNDLSRERTKLKASMPENHPTMRSLNTQLSTGKENILKTLEVNQRQISTSLANLNREKALAGEMFSRIPEKEKMLRAIERQQSIKENLFVLLLAKREEAAIKNAITAPVIKVIDYAQTPEEPLSPKRSLVYPSMVIIGLFVPFVILFVSFALDTKIRKREDVERSNPEIPILGEIPFIANYENHSIENERTLLTESFRFVCANLTREVPIEKGKTILIASSIKGEGKTATAVNLAKTFASMNKRVLLIGADLRNPRVHSYFNLPKEGLGFSDFINNPELNWQKCLYNATESHLSSLYICLSGAEPSDPPEIFANGQVARFFEAAKKVFDCIIVDTAPALLVSDTMMISEYADKTLFVLRAGLTEKRLLSFSKDLNYKKTFPQMSYILNGVGLNSASDNYNYGYGYGYKVEDTAVTAENKFKIYAEKLKTRLKNLIGQVEVVMSKILAIRKSN